MGACVIAAYIFTFVIYFFFFQAEDGIRDDLVTGVQTCALPIWLRVSIRHRFQKNLKQKTVFHHAVWHVFLAKKWPVYKKSLRENGSWQPKTVFRYGDRKSVV